MYAECSASDLFTKFMRNESNCSTNQMARKPVNVNKRYIYIYIYIYIHTLKASKTATFHIRLTFKLTPVYRVYQKKKKKKVINDNDFKATLSEANRVVQLGELHLLIQGQNSNFGAAKENIVLLLKMSHRRRFI